MRSTATTADAMAVNSAAIDVKCIGVSKWFRDFWMRPRVRAVESLDLEICRGQIFGLLGPNGSGKSTTIKMILGLVSPTAGRIAVLGRRPRDVATKRQIGYLPEESYLYGFLSARETLDFYGRLFRLPGRVRRDRIDQLLEMVGLEAVGHRPVREFSKGMQRRVGLAQALINDPQLLILDEPTSGMDPVGARQIRDLIADLGRRGKTVLLCTHQLSDVEDLCDTIAIMFGGRIRAHGQSTTLLAEETATLIRTPPLDTAITVELRDLLARHGLAPLAIERPKRKLEDVFLEVVDRARKEGVATSGARAGGPMPDFLRPDSESQAPPETGVAAVADQTIDTGLIESLMRKPSNESRP